MAIFTKVCFYCRREFEASYSLANICSTDCRLRTRRTEPKPGKTVTEPRKAVLIPRKAQPGPRKADPSLRKSVPGSRKSRVRPSQG